MGCTDKCCCCISLELGVLLIGVIEILFCSFLAFVAISDNTIPIPLLFVSVGTAIVGILCAVCLILAKRIRIRWFLLPYLCYTIAAPIYTAMFIIMNKENCKEFSGLVGCYVYIPMTIFRVYLAFYVLMLFLNMRKEKE